MKKLLLLIIAMLGILFTVQAQMGLLQGIIERKLNRTSADVTGTAPDYSQPYYWAATPYKHNCSDSIPSFLKDEVRDTLADVFYIHPTTFTANFMWAPWNADLSDTALNRQTDISPILFQASVFNGSCRIFAPRYRQAHLKTFVVMTTDNAKQAFDLAYGDIKKAFQYYLAHNNNGRPIIIASHSQGSLNAIRLLQEFFDGKLLQNQLVCAYLIGWPVRSNDFKRIPVGQSPGQTGCVVGWCSYPKGKKANDFLAPKEDGICVNPLTWTTDAQWALPDLNDGAVMHDFNKRNLMAAGAGITPGHKILWVTLNDDWDTSVKKKKNLHSYDYNIFWMNIRENVMVRIESFLKQRYPLPSLINSGLASGSE